MNESVFIHRVPMASWAGECPEAARQEAVRALEEGKVVFFPQLGFELKSEEQRFLNPAIVDGAKNVSYNIANGKITGCNCVDGDRADLAAMIKRFSEHAQGLLNTVIPAYRNKAKVGRTSLRPVEIAGRVSSWRKDDTRLHVDSFPATPLQGRRILRIFSNVNPDGKPRCWRVGDSFENVAKRFAPVLKAPMPGTAAVMQLFRITRGLRTPYDHYMLQMHDQMKADLDYQKNSPQLNFDFPPNTTWMVFTDQVPHAANAGQHQFEQTFYLTVDDMAEPARSPLRIMEKLMGAKLVN